MRPAAFLRLATLPVMILLPHAAAWAASPMQPGLWELDFATSVGKQSVPGEVSRECVTAKDIASATATLPRPGGDCKLSNVQATGKRTSYDLACTMDDGAMRGHMELVVEANRYSGTAEMKWKGGDQPERPVTMTIAARRLGDCP
jgi:hypothetical protein